MRVHVLNILYGENYSAVIQCVDEKTNASVNLQVVEIVNELVATPTSERTVVMNRLEEKVLHTYKDSLVPINGDKLCQWEKRTVCYDSRHPENNGKEGARLIFHLPYEKARSVNSLEYSADVSREFGSPIEALILLKKIKGPSLVQIDKVENGAVRMCDINIVSYGMPSVRIAYLYFLQRNLFETVSIYVCNSAEEKSSTQSDAGAYDNADEPPCVKKQKIETTENSMFVSCADSPGLHGYWTFTTLESPHSPSEFLLGNISKLNDADSVISRVSSYLNDMQASVVVCYNADTDVVREKLTGQTSMHDALSAAHTSSSTVSLICDLPRYMESVCRLTEYNLEEMSKSYGLVHADIPVLGSASSLSEAYASIQNGYLSDSARVLLDIARISAAEMHMIFKKGSLLPLAEKLSYITGALLNSIFHGFKSDRVEYLLLHRMRDNQYLIPKKLLAGKVDSKDTYEGGYVFLEKPGMYSDTYISLFDFNSLYPSIIQEYNVCFSTSHDLSMDSKNVSRPSLLPGALRDLVAQRTEIKKQMKAGKGDVLLLEIEQRAVKLVANCIYGCLGFKGFRFYNKAMAAFITECGRSILKDTKTTLESNGYRVIYGDTDSVMVDTGIGTSSAPPSNKLLDEISDSISCKYRTIKLGFEKTFLKLVMMAKKKYFGVVHSNGANEIEEKGLETGRRDWCEMAQEGISAVIRVLLYSTAPEEEILLLLAKLKEKIQTHNKESFLIRKKIQKAPESYNAVQGTSLQQVSLALRLQKERNFTFQAGDIISFVMALHNGVSRAELVSECGEIHYDYYMKMQLFPPIQRMLEYFPSISIESIQKLLGLYVSHSRPAQKSEPSDMPADIKEALAVVSPCCSQSQDIGMHCTACAQPFAPMHMKKLIRRVLYKQSAKLHKVKKTCFKCNQSEEYSPICLRCHLPIEWDASNTEHFHEFLYKLQNIFYCTPYKKYITDLLALSSYLTIDISKFPLNKFSDNLYIPSMVNRRDILDRLFL
ncbi:DNA polymerase alpha subunit A [Nematocida ausubeli]|nr:DNA polymerase alpha subunit A [Nematocida ausubeli]